MQSARQSWLAVLALAVLVRGGVALAAALGIGPLAGLDQDPDAYRRIAETLAETGTYGIRPDPLSLADAPATGAVAATTPAASGMAEVDPTAFRPPLYPWLLSWLVRDGSLAPTAVAVLHAMLGVVTVLGTYAVLRGGTNFGRQESAGAGAPALLAAALVAIDPLLVLQSSRLMTETLATAIAVGIWWGVVRAERQMTAGDPPQARLGTTMRVWAVPAILLALGFLCRPVFLVWMALLALWLAGRAMLSRGRWRTTATAAVVITLPTIVAAGLWSWRNYHTIGRPVWATTHGGYTLLLGNNPWFYDFLRSHSFGAAAIWGEAWDAEPFHQQWSERQRELRFGVEPPTTEEGAASSANLDWEIAENAAASDWARQTIREHPGMFVYASAVRVGRLWSPVPRIGGGVGSVSLAIGMYYVVIYLAAAGALLRKGRRRWATAWVVAGLLAVALTAVHAIYWSNLRMRAPVMPMVLAMAAVGVLGTGEKRGERGKLGG